MKNKRIAILTWLHNGNYGTMLQAYALQKFLRKNGYNVENINYKPSTKNRILNLLQNRNSPALFMGKVRAFFGKKLNMDREILQRRKNRFECFKNDNMNIGKLCASTEEIKEMSKNFDAYICGSDQIWSPTLMNPVFYLDYLPKSENKISYAPSMGVTDTTDRKKKQIKKYLESFNYVSVREKQGQKLLREITGNTYPVMVDPTMLLSPLDWEECTGERIVKGEYIFCYILTPRKSYIDAIKKFAKKKNMKVVIIPNDKGPFDTGFQEFADAGPEQWLNLLKYSSYVCTDSFHGCIFSAVFQREFILFKRFSDDNKKSENSRIYTLARMLQIEDRIIDSNNINMIDALKPINFKKIESTIRREGQSSGQWLIDALEDVCGN